MPGKKKKGAGKKKKGGKGGKGGKVERKEERPQEREVLPSVYDEMRTQFTKIKQINREWTPDVLTKKVGIFCLHWACRVCSMEWLVPFRSIRS